MMFYLSESNKQRAWCETGTIANKAERQNVQDGYKTGHDVYGAECWAVRKNEERKLHTTEMCMLRWARGKTRLDHVRNVDIWKEAHVYPMAEFLREKRLRWFGHVQRWDKDDATRKKLQMTVGRSVEREIETDHNRDGETWWKRIWQETRWQLSWEGRRQTTLACHGSSRQTTKCRGENVRKVGNLLNTHLSESKHSLHGMWYGITIKTIRDCRPSLTVMPNWCHYALFSSWGSYDIIGPRL